MSLQNRNVLITGGSVGIGKDIAYGLAASGASCTIIARGETDLVQSIADMPGDASNHKYFAMDVSSSNDWDRFGQWRSGQPDYTDLVCSAGIYGPIGPIGTYDIEKFSRTLDINLMGSVRAVEHLMCDLESNSGSVLLLAGGGASAPNPNFTPYGTSKAAIVRFAENIAAELADKNVIVNSCAPGFINTRLHEETMSAGADMVGDAFLKKTEDVTAGRSGDSTEDVVELARFLIDPENDRFTGKFVSVVWDAWRDPKFRELLRTDQDLATSRRIDDMFFRAIDQSK